MNGKIQEWALLGGNLSHMPINPVEILSVKLDLIEDCSQPEVTMLLNVTTDTITG